MNRQTEQRILEMYNRGISRSEIQKAIGLKNLQPISRCLERHGIAMRNMRQYQLDQSFFDVIDTEEKAYIVGFICADGHVDKKNGRVEFMISTKDIDILEKIKTAMGSNHPIERMMRKNPYQYSERKETEMCKLRLNSQDMCRSLSFFPDRKTYNLDSSIMDYIPPELRRHFLRGYFDGDGSICYGAKYSSGIKYIIQVCGNEDFLLGTFGVLFPTTNKMYKDLKAKQCWIWKVSSKKRVDDFLKYIYEDAVIYLERKFKVYQCAHVKPVELLESYVGNDMPISSQASEEEGSETIERLISED